MLDVAELAYECRGERVVRRLVTATSVPQPGVVVVPDVELEERAYDDPGWPATADVLAASLPGAAVLLGIGPRFSPSHMVDEIGTAARAFRKDPRCDGRVAIVGFGLGGSLAVTATAHEPRVSAVVAMGAAADLPRAGFGSASSLRRLVEAGLADPTDHASWRREFISQSPSHHLARLEGRPFLVVHGAADEEIPLLHARELASVPTSQMHVLPTAGHRLRMHPAAIEVAATFLGALFSAQP